MAEKIVFLVEGKDDDHVLRALFGHHGFPRTFLIKTKGGVSNRLDTLDVELLASELEKLGVILDADLDLDARWQRLTHTLRDAGYDSVPLTPEVAGTIVIEPGKPTVGIWLMPNNSLPGMLEDFVRFLVPRGDTLWQKAEACIDDISAAERLFPVAHKAKAHIHTWLSWQHEPGTPLGLAITKQYLNAESQQALRLVNWARRLGGFP